MSKDNELDIIAELQQMLDEAGMTATLYGKPVHLVELRDDLGLRFQKAIAEVKEKQLKPHEVMLTPTVLENIDTQGEAVAYFPLQQAVDEHDGTFAGAVHPARESGWIAWWPGRDPLGELAEFTRKQYKHGFASPYQPGDVLCAESNPDIRVKVTQVTVDRRQVSGAWVWAVTCKPA